MSDILSDEWISQNSWIDAKKIHALGLVALNWNSAEIMMRALFTAASRLSIKDVTTLTHDLPAPSIENKLRYFAKNRDHTPEAASAILHGVDLFAANRINRNDLAHFIPSGGKGGVDFWSAKGAQFMGRGTIPNELGDLRRVAEEIAELSRYLGEMVNYLWPVDSLRGPRQPLPEKPAVPSRLWTPPTPQQS